MNYGYYRHTRFMNCHAHVMTLFSLYHPTTTTTTPTTPGLLSGSSRQVHEPCIVCCCVKGIISAYCYMHAERLDTSEQSCLLYATGRERSSMYILALIDVHLWKLS